MFLPWYIKIPFNVNSDPNGESRNFDNCNIKNTFEGIIVNYNFLECYVENIEKKTAKFKYNSLFTTMFILCMYHILPVAQHLLNSNNCNFVLIITSAVIFMSV